MFIPNSVCLGSKEGGGGEEEAGGGGGQVRGEADPRGQVPQGEAEGVPHPVEGTRRGYGLLGARVQPRLRRPHRQVL